MFSHRLITFVIVFGACALACASADAPPPKLVPPYPGDAGTWGAPSVYPPPSADPSPAAPAVEASPPPPAPSVSCVTVDDCWMDGAYNPIRRPARERGKKIAPCKHGEHGPACADGVCVVRAYKC